MTNKVTMPEPVASRWRWRDIENDPWKTTQGTAWKNPTAAPKLEVEQLITTAQAEAYANARVREALEDAASMADDVFAISVGDSIRALIPKENT